MHKTVAHCAIRHAHAYVKLCFTKLQYCMQKRAPCETTYEFSTYSFSVKYILNCNPYWQKVHNLKIFHNGVIYYFGASELCEPA